MGDKTNYWSRGKEERRGDREGKTGSSKKERRTWGETNE